MNHLVHLSRIVKARPPHRRTSWRSYLLDTHSQIPRRVPDIIMAEEVQKGPTVEPTSVDEKEHLTVTAGGTVVDHGLHRQLKQRHMQMISLGGVIGYGSRLLLIATR